MVTVLEKLERERESLKVLLGRLETKVAGHAAVPMSESMIDTYLSQAQQCQAKLNENYDKIVALAPADVTPYDAEHLAMLDRVEPVVWSLQAIKNTFVPTAIPVVVPKAAAVRLPRLDLPTFDGNIQNWMSFHDMFNAAVHNDASLTKAQKLTYLKSALTGEAASQVKALPITDGNYDIACDQLKARYHNDRELLFAVLRRFVNQPSISKSSSSSLRSLIDVSKECFNSLRSLKLSVDRAEFFLLFHMAVKLDNTTREMWEQTLTTSAIPPLKDFLDFLEQRARALAAGGISQPNHQQSAQGGKPHRDNSRKIVANHVQAPSSCALCTGNHPLFKCSRFLAMTVQEKSEQVKKFKLCYNCLHSGHSVANCSSRGTCRTCNGKHHTLLHRGNSPPSDPSTSNTEQAVGMHCQAPERTVGMLATALVKIQDHRGQSHLCRALLDGGSTSSFITESCLRRLGLPRRRISAEILGLASTAVCRAKGLATLKLIPKFPDNPSYSIQALVLAKVTARLPTHSCDPSIWPHLKGLELADPTFYQPDHVDILLGADIFYSCLMNETKTGPVGCPMAIKTTFGWIVAGEIAKSSSQIIVNYSDLDMELQLNKLWDIETVSSTRTLTQEEQDCETHFQLTHTINEIGKFVVQLPLKTPQPVLGSSRDVAVRRLKQLEGRFTRAPDRHKQYKAFMQEYIALGHMEEIPPAQVPVPQSQSCYIPHHFVCKESSTTTKLRVVFDASAKTSSGVSLNDALMVGPTIQDNLADILLRFRIHPIAFTADVAKMYRQILVTPSNTDLQRIVWRNSPSEPIRDYRLLTVTYGTASAPFLATRSLQQLALNHQESLPLASHAVVKDMYVDDLMSGAPTQEIAQETVLQLLQLMQQGSMELRKWTSNSPLLLSHIPSELRETQPLLSLDFDQTIKALGVYWDPVTDRCSFKVMLDFAMQGKQLTKRNVLSEISKIFDPLGWLAPVIIKARILIQQLWKLQLGWDETLPEEVQQQWLVYRDGLHHLEQLSIPRCIMPEIRSRINLVGFCDASERAYAAVVYVCAYETGKSPVISLVASKTRVAPAKTVSLPRLELCGALLLSQLITNVQGNLNIPFTNTTAWTDSTVVLAWINAHPSRWKTFVGNRITEIQERVPARLWGHVSGKDNPADCASRGLDPDELNLHPLWWNGPHWIQTEEYAVKPYCATNNDMEAVYLEEKSPVICSHATPKERFLITSYSSLWKLIRVTAYLYRFHRNALISVQSTKNVYPAQVTHRGPLTPDELQHSLHVWIRIAQHEQFSREIQCLEKNTPVSPKSSLCALSPFMDTSGIMRVGGRLRHSQLPNAQRKPILIPRHHPITSLIIMSEHKKNLHAGPQLLLSILHQRFWIVRARDAIRHQLKQCLVCTRMAAATLHQFMGDFPAARVTPTRPFLRCGVDYAGPFLVKPISPRSKTTIKAYVALFVCFATHAIHLEVVSALTTAAFIPALHRFVSRRGKPSDIYSDCGSNFVGAAKEIREAEVFLSSKSHNEEVADSLARDNIHWHFNPPSAPHFGGLWEAGVKSMKYHLKRVVGLARLTFEEMTTVMTQIEACLNSRPLTPVSTDPNDFTALTPGHFLVGSPLTALAEVNLTAENTGRLSRWQHVQQLNQHFWHRWSNEYIARLQQRPKWQNRRAEIQQGDMVIIKDDRLPPLKWQLGRVTELHPGADGLTRVVTLRTALGETKRNITKLCLLPIDPPTAIEPDNGIVPVK